MKILCLLFPDKLDNLQHCEMHIINWINWSSKHIQVWDIFETFLSRTSYLTSHNRKFPLERNKVILFYINYSCLQYRITVLWVRSVGENFIIARKNSWYPMGILWRKKEIWYLIKYVLKSEMIDEIRIWGKNKLLIQLVWYYQFYDHQKIPSGS